MTRSGSGLGRWTFLSNHCHVLLCLDRHPDITLRDVAEKVGITERAVQRIVGELEQAEILTRHREGRRNRYAIHRHLPLRHPLESHHTVGELLDLLESQRHPSETDSAEC